MDESFRDRTAFIRGAKDIAKEVKKHAAKKVSRGMDRVQDEYTRRSYSRFEEEEDDEDYAPQDGYYRGGEGANEEEGVSSDATEGHDEEDEIYEGEYQGIPRQESLKGGERLGAAAAAGAFDDSEGQRRKDREELAQQYELILQECGHGRFQWTLYFVLGLALMADGVEVFVVGFVLPSAEKDMCHPIPWIHPIPSHPWIPHPIPSHPIPRPVPSQAEQCNHGRLAVPKGQEEAADAGHDTGASWGTRRHVRLRADPGSPGLALGALGQHWECVVPAHPSLRSYYGLTVWFPDMIKHLQSIEYASRTKLFTREKVRHFTFNFTLENQVHRGGEYFNDKFIGLKMKSVTFEDSLFEECYFEDITSSNTFFKNCTFISTVFYNTDLFEYKFINSRVVNSTFLHNKEGCQLDFSDDNNAYMIYFVSFLGTLAVLPGNIVSALLMDKIGRLRMLAGSSVMSCVSCFFLSFGNSESAMIALLCLFGGVSIASWNALDVLTVELYPSDKRTTAFGFLNALCKLAAVLGISIFTSFVGITKAVPILFASAALALGSSLALKLPETRGQVLQ
uniref:SV2A/B/C luminal domain-containing protein n=1 Tax=Malurus cyaneus samueli TaxID=2593467 RepID=A0A8C5TBE2_9PASS